MRPNSGPSASAAPALATTAPRFGYSNAATLWAGLGLRAGLAFSQAGRRHLFAKPFASWSRSGLILTGVHTRNGWRLLSAVFGSLTSLPMRMLAQVLHMRAASYARSGFSSLPSTPNVVSTSFIAGDKSRPPFWELSPFQTFPRARHN